VFRARAPDLWRRLPLKPRMRSFEAAAAGAADALAAEEAVFGTISGANLPAACTLVVDLFVSQAT